MTTDSSTTSDGEIKRNEPEKEMKLSPYEKVCSDVNSDERYLKELALGRRIGFYRVRGELGSGNFSRVKMGVHVLTKDKVAIKILDKTKLDSKTQRLLSREISSMENLHHPNIIRLYEVIETLTKLHLVMEFANGGELFTKISTEGKLSERTTKRMFCQIVAALDHMKLHKFTLEGYYIRECCTVWVKQSRSKNIFNFFSKHEHNIIHRDLKAENIFIAGTNLVKIGDFGFSTSATPDAALNTFCGSPPYAAPELFKDECYLGTCVDIWALGILLYFMVTGVMPFRADTVGKLKKCILDGMYFMPDFLTDSCKHLIKRVLQLIPKDRLTMDEIKNANWLQGEVFPDEEVKWSHYPPASKSCSEEEREARCSLEELGVPFEEKNSSCTDIRSNITGTYQVVLHRIQKEKLEEKKASSDISNDVTKNGHSKIILPRSTKSKLCVIL